MLADAFFGFRILLSTSDAPSDRQRPVETDQTLVALAWNWRETIETLHSVWHPRTPSSALCEQRSRIFLAPCCGKDAIASIPKLFCSFFGWPKRFPSRPSGK